MIQGDNLLALRALMPLYAGRVKCIFIDPPYNTQSAFEHYDDKLEHSQWLSMMYPRLVLLRDLLAEDGSIWVTLDDNEAHYMKVMMDEIFGRKNFVSNVIWEKSDSPRMDAALFSTRHDHLIVYAKTLDSMTLKKMPNDLSELPKHYDKVDDEGRSYYLKPLRAMGQADRREDRPTMFFPLDAPDGEHVYPIRQDGSDGRWRWGEDKIAKESWRIDWTNGRNGWTPYFRVYADSSNGRPPETIWFNAEVGSNRTSKAEIKKVIDHVSIFDTPKPESLIKKLIMLTTDGGDLILDSFLGSGTTAAVAHKMGRRYIGIEMGEHAKTHCIPRLQKVIEGEQGGISQSVEWQGGCGFGFYTLHPEPVFQANGQIRPDIKFEPLAAYIWHMETGVGSSQTMDSPLLGVHNGIAYYLLYNGILGDRRPQGGNVLTRPILAWLQAEYPHDGPKVIYGESIRIGEERLAQANVTFKQIPYDVVLR